MVEVEAAQYTTAGVCACGRGRGSTAEDCRNICMWWRLRKHSRGLLEDVHVMEVEAAQ